MFGIRSNSKSDRRDKRVKMTIDELVTERESLMQQRDETENAALFAVADSQQQELVVLNAVTHFVKTIDNGFNLQDWDILDLAESLYNAAKPAIIAQERNAATVSRLELTYASLAEQVKTLNRAIARLRTSIR